MTEQETLLRYDIDARLGQNQVEIRSILDLLGDAVDAIELDRSDIALRRVKRVIEDLKKLEASQKL